MDSWRNVINNMATILSIAVILVCLCDVSWSISYQETRVAQRISKTRRFEESNDDNRTPFKNCRSDADCAIDEYCHAFHRLCLRPNELVTVAPVKTSAKTCSTDSDCKSEKEYCHDFWRICLPSQKGYVEPPTKRPSWYCRRSKDCKLDEQCHKRFHTCYTRPRMPTVRRDTGNSRPRCGKTSDCGANYYCHEHFHICLKNISNTTNPKAKTTKLKTCDPKTPSCPKGMLCHDLWNICFTPAPVVTLPKSNKTQQCQIDSDCKPDEFCHIISMATQSRYVVARQRRHLQSLCVPLRFLQAPKNSGDKTCKSNADCGPNKCCLGHLGVCMAYKLPGEMCLTAKTDFVCPCVSGSHCKARGKWASPRRIINKMKLPQAAANHFLKASNKNKRKIGKCTPSSF